jgi:hypothetical protein
MDHFSNTGHMLCKFPEKAGPWPIVPLMVKEVLSGPYPVIFPEITFPCAPLLLYYVSLAIDSRLVTWRRGSNCMCLVIFGSTWKLHRGSSIAYSFASYYFSLVLSYFFIWPFIGYMFILERCRCQCTLVRDIIVLPLFVNYVTPWS